MNSLHHILAAFLGNGVLAESALGDDLIQQRHFGGLRCGGLGRQRIRLGYSLFVSLRLAAKLGAQLVQLFGL